MIAVTPIILAASRTLPGSPAPHRKVPAHERYFIYQADVSVRVFRVARLSGRRPPDRRGALTDSDRLNQIVGMIASLLVKEADAEIPDIMRYWPDIGGQLPLGIAVARGVRDGVRAAVADAQRPNGRRR
jgi:hypothetical protein